MFAVLVAAAGLLVAIGIACIVRGADIIVLEAGWSMVIAGSVVATGGVILAGLAFVLRELRGLSDRLSRDLPQALAAAGLGATAADTARERLLALDEVPGAAEVVVAPEAGSQGAAPAEARLEPTLPLWDLPVPDVAEPEVKPVLAPAEPPLTAKEERLPPAENWPATLEPTIAPSAGKPAAAEGVLEAGSASVPVAEIRAEVRAEGGEEIKEEAKEEAKGEKSRSPFLPEPPAWLRKEPVPPREVAEPTIPWPDMPGISGEKAPEAPAKAPPLPGFLERVKAPFSFGRERDSLAPEPVPFAEPAAKEATSKEEIAKETLFEKPISETAALAPAIPEEDRHAEEERPRKAPAEELGPLTPVDRPAAAVKEGSAAGKAGEGAAAAVPSVVGTYSAGGNLYVMFSDGSIEAETSRGVFRFKSLDELKTYIAKGEFDGDAPTPDPDNARAS